jgi:hypothetical protein
MKLARNVLALACAVQLGLSIVSGQTELAAGAVVRLHAHNCYPEDGQWSDRIDRALSTGLATLAIEQDLVWKPGADSTVGRSVVSHGAPLSGSEPDLEAYFFARVRPIVERALAEGNRRAWPIIVLHLDFKTNEPEHHQAIWSLLGRYESWLTTAGRAANPRDVQPLDVKPVLVLTEQGDGQQKIFHDDVPVGAKLRIFGTVPSGYRRGDDDAASAARRAVELPVDQLIPEGRTNYRRWVNFSWGVVEEGGQAAAGEWTAADASRLNAITARARTLGLWTRFYTLNGHAPSDGLGWTASYNFGSSEAVTARWRAAIAARVDFVATDQYEAFARLLASR